MKRILLFLIFLPILSYSQSMSLSDGSFIRVSNGAKIIFENSSPNQIQKDGSIGGILTEGEDSKIIFKNVNQLGIYSVPFVSSQGNTIPFTFTINTLGSNFGDIHFSTWETSDDNFPFPSSVNAVNDMSGLDNSTNVIDRFWYIDLIGYSNKPKGEYEFTYDDNDIIGNSLTESNLVSQRWNSDILAWGDWLY